MVRATWFRRISSFSVTAIMAGFGLTGIASAQMITNTGPDSTNTITTTNTNNCSISNKNHINAVSLNSQYASSGDASEEGNTTAGVSWAGWSALDPTLAQSNGESYASWNSSVTSWISARAAGGNWAGAADNLSWAPSGSDWNSYDPMSWQANGQSFGNWYNAVEAYLNSNSAAWLLSWPADDTGGTSAGGAVSGNATNVNNASFSININNAARAAAGTNSCGQSNFTPPPSSGGMGGGGPVSLGSSVVPQGKSSGGSGGVGGGGLGAVGGGGGSFFSAPVSHPVSAPAVVASSAPATVSTPSAGGSGGGSPSSAPVSSISNTGPNSSNSITTTNTNNSSVNNCNNVSASSLNFQQASSGSSEVSGNTTAGGGGSGNASNGNGTGVVGDINN